MLAPIIGPIAASNTVTLRICPNFISRRQFDHLLREEVGFSVPSWAVDDIKSLADVQAWTKIGVWANIGEFNRIETTDGKLNYGFVILGLPQTEPGTVLAEELGVDSRLVRRWLAY